MSTIKLDRRRADVALYQGSTIAKLDALTDQVETAERAEQSNKRMGTKSQAMALAKEYDDLVANADADAVHVTVWAIGRRDWKMLADEHPPREDEKQDALYGVHMGNFPDALVALAILAPDEGDHYDDRVKLGNERIDALGDLSQVQWMKIARAAWDVNVGDDALPKSSLVLLLQDRKERASKRQQDSA